LGGVLVLRVGDATSKSRVAEEPTQRRAVQTGTRAGGSRRDAMNGGWAQKWDASAVHHVRSMRRRNHRFSAALRVRSKPLNCRVLGGTTYHRVQAGLNARSSAPCVPRRATISRQAIGSCSSLYYSTSPRPPYLLSPRDAKRGLAVGQTLSKAGPLQSQGSHIGRSCLGGLRSSVRTDSVALTTR